MSADASMMSAVSRERLPGDILAISSRGSCVAPPLSGRPIVVMATIGKAGQQLQV